MPFEMFIFPIIIKGMDPRDDDPLNVPVPATTIEYTLTGELGTPSSIPFDLDLPTNTTSSITLSDPLVELVESETAHVRAMAFLPGDEKADEIVERLMARTDSAVPKRSLS